MSVVHTGDCFRCRHRGLLYEAVHKDGTVLGKVVLICYECRELIRKRSK